MNPPIPIQKPLVDMIDDVVKATESVILPYLKSVDPKIVHLHYEHGHPREIVNTLANMNMPQVEQFKKYPLVALFQDIRESIGGIVGNYGTAPLNIIIATQTEATYNANDRYARSFLPILLPIYHSFIDQLLKSKYFQITSINQIPHTKTDHVYWGKKGLYGSEADIFKDKLDAVEIEGLVVPIRKSGCTPTKFTNI